MKHIAIILLFIPLLSWAQKTEKLTKEEMVYVSESLDTIAVPKTKNPLRASLYSAMLPGMGQIYNEQYLKAPIVWGLLGVGIGFTSYYNGRYHHYRDAYLAELNGETHEYSNILSKESLASIQDDFRRNRDYAIAVTTLVYVLNILDATVDAHLYEIRRDRDLSLEPTALLNPVSGKVNMGLALKINLE